MIKRVKSFLFENKTDKQTIMKNTFWLMLAEGISKGGIFFITVLIARMLGPEQFGVLNFVMSFVAMFIVITDFGLTTLMVREVSRDHSKVQDYIVNLSFLKVILGIITFLIVWIVSHFIGKDDLYITLILIYCAYSIIFNFGEFIRAVFRPSEMMQYEALLKIINGVLMLVIVLYALFTYGDLVSIMYAYLISGILSLIVSLFYVGRKFEIGKVRLDKELIKNNLRSGAYLMLTLGSIGIFANADKLMLGFFGFEKELGVYSAIFKLVNILSLLITMFVFAVIPNMLKSYSLVKMKKLIKTISIIGISALIIGILFGKNIIYIMYGVDYSTNSSYIMLIILLIMFLFNSLNTLFFHYLNHIGIEKGIFYFTLVSLTLSLVLNYLLIPIYKGIGAGLVSLILEIVMTSLIMIFYRKKLFRKA